MKHVGKSSHTDKEQPTLRNEVGNLITFPNALTCSNLISGCIATYFAFNHCPDLALMWIIIGAVFDFFDGMSARALHISSPIGVEIDSLADDITFGVAPSTILFAQLQVMDYPVAFGAVAHYVPFVAFLMAAFSALRLAKFNIDKRQTMGFIGLATPANALFWGGLILTFGSCLEDTAWGWLVLIALMCLSCWLLICEIPMFALKFKHLTWHGNEVRLSFVLLTFLILIVSVIVHGARGFLSAWCWIIPIYILLSLVVWQKGRHAAPAES